MPNFLDEARNAQKQQVAKQITPQQVYEKMHRAQLHFSLADIKNKIIDAAKDNPTSKILKGTIPLRAGQSNLARINQVADVNTEYYTINRNYIPGDDYYDDYCTGHNETWMRTAALCKIEEDCRFFGNKCRISLTKRGKVFFDELKRMCAAENITVNFCAHAAWRASNGDSADFFVDFDHEFKAKGRLFNVYLAVNYLVKL